MNRHSERSDSKHSTQHRGGPWARLIALLVMLMLVVSSGPTAQADPVSPDEPKVSSVVPRDDGGDPSVFNEPDPAPEPSAPADDAAPGTITWGGPRTEASPPPSGGGYIPAPFDTSPINDGQYQSTLRGSSALPSVYTVTDDYPTALSSVRDQGSWGTCWAFAAATSAEASLVRNGVLSGTETPEKARQVSTLHTVQGVYYTNTFKANTAKPLARNGPYQQGGNQYQAAAAWSHWYGAQKESTYPYPTNKSKAPAKLSAAKRKSSAFHLRGMYILPAPRTTNNVLAIKQGVFDYGPAFTAFAASRMSQSYNFSTAAFYDSRGYRANHAVTIIGWDDDFSRTNFKTPQPPGDGAFLLQNSWGGYIDYFYISYYDKSMTESAVFDMIGAGTTPGRHSPYDWTGQYYHDGLGMGHTLTNSTNKVSFANRFNVRSTRTLRAVQFVTHQPNMNYTISVYTGKIKPNSPITGGKAQALTLAGKTSVSGTVAYAGYHTVPLEKPVILKKGQKFSIVVTLSVPSGSAFVGVEARYNYGAGASRLTLGAGQTFFKENGSWKDAKTIYKKIRATGRLGNVNVIGLTSKGPEYTLTYDANGGTVATTSKAVAYGSPVGALAKPTLTGYAFTNWYTAPTGGTKYTKTTTYPVLDNKTVYAHWKAKKYTLTFNANGGTAPKTGSKATKTKSVTFDGKYGTLPTSTRKGYTFEGWFTAKIGGEQILADAQVTSASNVTLYAQWTPV